MALNCSTYYFTHNNFQSRSWRIVGCVAGGVGYTGTKKFPAISSRGNKLKYWKSTAREDPPSRKTEEKMMMREASSCIARQNILYIYKMTHTYPGKGMGRFWQVNSTE